MAVIVGAPDTEQVSYTKAEADARYFKLAGDTATGRVQIADRLDVGQRGSGMLGASSAVQMETWENDNRRDMASILANSPRVMMRFASGGTTPGYNSIVGYAESDYDLTETATFGSSSSKAYVVAQAGIIDTYQYQALPFNRDAWTGSAASSSDPKTWCYYTVDSINDSTGVATITFHWRDQAAIGYANEYLRSIVEDDYGDVYDCFEFYCAYYVTQTNGAYPPVAQLGGSSSSFGETTKMPLHLCRYNTNVRVLGVKEGGLVYMTPDDMTHHRGEITEKVNEFSGAISTNVESPTKGTYIRLQPGAYLLVGSCAMNTGASSGARNVDISIWSGTSTSTITTRVAYQRLYLYGNQYTRQSVWALVRPTSATYYQVGVAASISGSSDNNCILQAVRIA